MNEKLPPYWLVRSIDSIRKALLFLNQRMFPGSVVLYEQFQNLWLLPSLYVAARLDIATLLKAGPMHADEIAKAVNADPGNIHRLLRALAGEGVFTMKKDGRFALNRRAEALLDESGSLRHMLLHHLGPVNWNLMSQLTYAVTTGKNAFEYTYGKPIYDYLKDHPEENRIFDRSMSDLSELSLGPVLSAYDFSPYRLIADIGGGEGHFLAHILKKHPAAKGILFDTAEALANASGFMSATGVQDRISFIDGDFFSDTLPGADLYLLKNIIHNWDDPPSVRLLSNISRVMPTGGRLLIIEMVVPEGNQPSTAKLLDIQMMVSMTGGKERTRTEYERLLAGSGLKLTRIVPTIAPVGLVEAIKIPT